MKWRILIPAVMILASIAALGQSIDSAIYVKNFPGLNVGAKVTNAMATCGTNAAVPCILVIDPSLASAAPGTLPTLCGHCYLMDFRNGPPSSVGMTELTNDVLAGPGSGSQSATLKVVNAGPGSCGDSTHVCVVVTDSKGRVTSQTPVLIAGGGGGGGGSSNITVTQNPNLAGSRCFSDVSNPDTTPPTSPCVFQNTSTTAMFVVVSGDLGGGGFHGDVYSDSSATPTTLITQFGRVNAGSSSPNFYPASAGFFVPAGNYYGISVTNGAGTPSIRSWTEYSISAAGGGGSGSGALTPYGTIYSANSWTDLSAFTPNGVTPTVSAGTLVFSGGDGGYTQSLDYSYYTQIPIWSMTCTYTLGALNSTSYGMGCGIRSTTPDPVYQWSVAAVLEADNGGANSGRLFLASINNNAPTIQSTGIPANLTLTAGDSIQIIVTRNYDKMTATAQDLTTGQLNYAAFSYVEAAPIMPNNGRFAVYNVGGTNTLTGLSISSGQPKGADVAEIFDSKGMNFPDFIMNAHSILLQQFYRSEILSGSGDESIDFVHEVPEVIALNPKVAIVEAPGNDVRLSVSLGTTEANVSSVVSLLQAAGIRVYVTTYPQENSGVDFSALNAWITSTYPTTYIDLTHGFISGSVPSTWLEGSGVHPVNAYHQWIAQTIANRLQADGIAQQFPYYIVP